MLQFVLLQDLSVDANGNITNIVVIDGSFKYGKTGTASAPIKVTDIKQDDVKDIGDTTYATPDASSVASFDTTK